jgi:hypothetical protein
MAKVTYENINDSGVFRRQIFDDCDNCKFDLQFLAHISRYDKAVDLMLNEAKRLGRPLNVVNIGCGQMFELRVLVSAYWVKKSDIIASYTAIDIEPQEVPVGPSLQAQLNYKFIVQDLTIDSTIPVSNVDIIIYLDSIEHIDKNSGMNVLKSMHTALNISGLLYLTTPNATNNKFEDKYHRYEWTFEELLEELEKLYEVESAAGVFISDRKFREANGKYGMLPADLDISFAERFSKTWMKIVRAAPYPEYSDNVAFIARKVH